MHVQRNLKYCMNQQMQWSTVQFKIAFTTVIPPKECKTHEQEQGHTKAEEYKACARGNITLPEG